MCFVLIKIIMIKFGIVVEFGKGLVVVGKYLVRLYIYLWLFFGVGCVEGEGICNCCFSGGVWSKSGVGDVIESCWLVVFG